MGLVNGFCNLPPRPFVIYMDSVAIAPSKSFYKIKMSKLQALSFHSITLLFFQNFKVGNIFIKFLCTNKNMFENEKK